jgi:predicted RNase H-like HicB family nuclease
MRRAMVGGDYLIVIEGDGSTNYSTYCPDVPGVVATGDTIEECVETMRVALALHIESLIEDGQAVPPAVSRPAVIHVDAA